MTQIVSDRTLNYNGKDCYNTFACIEAYFKDLKRPAFSNPPQIETPDFWETYSHTIKLYEPLIYMMSRGLKVDLNELAATRVKISTRLVELQREINEICGADINPQSPKQLQDYFYVKKGIKPYTKRNAKDQSSITVDDKALQRLAKGTSARSGLREARLIQEFRKLSKLRGTYLDIKFDDDNRLRCSYNPRGTRFARLSSSKTIFGTGMNMQNLDPAFQQFLVADSGCFFIQLDKAQAEWVVVAYASGEENMISAIERGVDVHVHTASRMFGVPEELVILDNKLIGYQNDPDVILEIRRGEPRIDQLVSDGRWLPRTMSMRQCGKKSNHGLNYDETYKMFSFINEITEKEAQVIVNYYHSIYPGLRRWYENIKQTLTTNGRVLTNLFGRPYKFLGKWDQDLWKSAYSFIPQSTVGELVNRAMIEIYNSKAPELETVEIMQQVHDNLLLQVPQINKFICGLGHTAETLSKIMDIPLNVAGRTFTIKTDMKVGYNLKDMVSVKLSSDLGETTNRIVKALDGCKRSW